MKKLVLVGLCVTFLSMATFAFAEDVYVTKHGKKYHKAACQLIKNKETTTMDLAQAEQKSLEPCLKCFKTKVLEAPTPKESKKIK